MNLMCKIFGHKNKLLFDMPTACVRCGQERPAVKLKHIPPMPKVKQPKNGVGDIELEREQWSK